MTQRRSSERDRIALLRDTFARNAPHVDVAIGDDAAVIAWPAMPSAPLASHAPGAALRADPMTQKQGQGAAVYPRLVWTVDAQVEGTHFRLDWLTWEDLGWRSFMAAASDLAAMGATPLGALSSLVLSPSVTDDDLLALARGQAAAADRVGAPVVGGNLARGDTTSVTTTLVGTANASEPILRSGALAGDRLWLAGPVGQARAGMTLVSQRAVSKADDVMLSILKMYPAFGATCIEAWRRPCARFAEGYAMRGRAHAAIDVSDGLALDVARLAEASNVDVVLDAGALTRAFLHDARNGDEPYSTRSFAARREHPTRASSLEEAALDFALYGGEDYALVVASPEPIAGFQPIGEVRSFTGAASRVFVRGTPSDPPVAIDVRGFDHFGEATT